LFTSLKVKKTIKDILDLLIILKEDYMNTTLVLSNLQEIGGPFNLFTSRSMKLKAKHLNERNFSKQVLAEVFSKRLVNSKGF